MKKTILRLVIAAMMMVPILSYGQTAIDKLYEKYAGTEGITSINISSAMFGMFANLEEFEDEEAEEYRESLSKLTGMKILSYEPEGEAEFDLLAELKKLTPLDKYEELMVIDSPDGGVRFLALQDDDEIIEMLMIATEDNDVTIMSFSGILDIDMISKISKSMGMHKMENMDIKIDEE